MESLCSIPEINVTLCVDCTSIKKNKQLKPTFFFSEDLIGFIKCFISQAEFHLASREELLKPTFPSTDIKK